MRVFPTLHSALRATVFKDDYSHMPLSIRSPGGKRRRSVQPKHPPAGTSHRPAGTSTVRPAQVMTLVYANPSQCHEARTSNLQRLKIFCRVHASDFSGLFDSDAEQKFDSIRSKVQLILTEPPPTRELR